MSPKFGPEIRVAAAAVAVTNLNGGLAALFGQHHVALLLALSVVTILWAAWAWVDLDRGFSAAILATMLVSYHFNPQDLSLCLVPFFLSRKAGILPGRRLPMFAFLALFAPTGLAAIGAPFALLAVLLAAALWWLGKNALRRLRLNIETGQK